METDSSSESSHYDMARGSPLKEGENKNEKMDQDETLEEEKDIGESPFGTVSHRNSTSQLNLSKVVVDDNEDMDVSNLPLQSSLSSDVDDVNTEEHLEDLESEDLEEENESIREQSENTSIAERSDSESSDHPRICEEDLASMHPPASMSIEENTGIPKEVKLALLSGRRRSLEEQQHPNLFREMRQQASLPTSPNMTTSASSFGGVLNLSEEEMHGNYHSEHVNSAFTSPGSLEDIPLDTDTKTESTPQPNRTDAGHIKPQTTVKNSSSKQSSDTLANVDHHTPISLMTIPFGSLISIRDDLVNRINNMNEILLEELNTYDILRQQNVEFTSHVEILVKKQRLLYSQRKKRGSRAKVKKPKTSTIKS